MLKIRRYSDSDKEIVHQLHVSALKPTGAFLDDGPWNEDLRDIPKHYLDDCGEFLLGELDGKVVCMGAIRKKSDTNAEIKRMRVLPEHQRKGLGQLILNALEERARQLGYSQLCLDTTTKQIGAQTFYEKNGYIEVRRDKFMGFELIFYEKNL